MYTDQDAIFFAQAAQTPTSFGADPNVDALSTLLGSIAGGAVNSPQLQSKLLELTDSCKIKAKDGVSEWMIENWQWLALGGATIVLGNYIMLVWGIVPLVRNRR